MDPKHFILGVGAAGSSYYIKGDWLPYLNYGSDIHDQSPWCDPTMADHCLLGETWHYSLRGDWNKKYWDKTANQAFHFWFYVAVAFFHGRDLSTMGDFFHDHPWEITSYDFSGSDPTEAPPPWDVASQPDKDLADIGAVLGKKLADEEELELLVPGLPRTDLGDWIRKNLK